MEGGRGRMRGGKREREFEGGRERRGEYGS